MVITEHDLVECLSEMEFLEELFIGDVPSTVPGDADHVLITNSLLQRLTWTPEPSCLTPKLGIFAFASLLTFDDHVLLQFVTSRLVSGRTDDDVFELEIYWHLAAAERTLDQAVETRMLELEEQGNLSWSMLPIEDIER